MTVDTRTPLIVFPEVLFLERGQAGYDFTSPNTGDTAFQSAHSAIGGERHKSFLKASGEVDRSMGGGKSASAVGAWEGGADNSVMTRHNGDWDHLKTGAAMKAHLGDQKSTLVFQRGAGASAGAPEHQRAHLHTFEAKGTPSDISKGLLGHGLANHTVVPHAGGATVHAVGIGGEQGQVHDAVKKAATAHGTTFKSHPGRAEFIGSSGEGTDRQQRDASRKGYEDVISKSPVKGVAKTWGRIHGRWGDELKQPGSV